MRLKQKSHLSAVLSLNAAYIFCSYTFSGEKTERPLVDQVVTLAKELSADFWNKVVQPRLALVPQNNL